MVLNHIAIRRTEIFAVNVIFNDSTSTICLILNAFIIICVSSHKFIQVITHKFIQEKADLDAKFVETWMTHEFIWLPDDGQIVWPNYWF